MALGDKLVNLEDLKVVGDEVSDLKSAFVNKVGNDNVLFSHGSYVVESTSTYASEVVYTKSGISEGDKYKITADSVSGVTATKPFWIRVQDNNGTNIRQLSGASSQDVTISASDISSGATKVQFVLYPAQGTTMPTGKATFTNLVVIEGTQVTFTYSADLDEHILSFTPTITSDVNKSIEIIEGSIYKLNSVSVASSSTGYRLDKSTGLAVQDANYDIQRYAVQQGDYIRVVSDNLFQFQTTDTVPTTGASNRIGETYGEGVFLIEAPATATYLIISTPTVSSASVSTVDDIIDNISSTVSIVNSIALDADIKFVHSDYRISVNKNNDGNSTYIYKHIEFAVNAKDMVCISCQNVQNNVMDKPFYVYQYDSSNTSINIASYTLAQVKNGLVINPLDGAAKIDVRLYPSSTGGLTSTECIFTDVIVWTSKDGHLRIKPESAPDEFAVPAYYLKDSYLQNKILAILEAQELAEGNYDCFIFCTDQHWSLNQRNSPKIINYMCKCLNMPRMFMGGDYDNGINMEAYRAFEDCYNGQIYNIAGNHEYMDQYKPLWGNYVSRTITSDTIWASMNGNMTDAVVGDAHKNYYYVDNTVQKMRYIILNVFTDSSAAEFSSAQKTWLQNVALNLPSGYTAIIFAHYVAEPDHTTGTLTLTSVGEEIAGVADAYSGSGEIACIINGHTHFDGLGATTGGIPIFVTTCDKCTPQTGYDDWLTDYRTAETITEQAFDVFVIDKTNEKVKAIRIGCPANNPGGSALEIRQADY